MSKQDMYKPKPIVVHTANVSTSTSSDETCVTRKQNHKIFVCPGFQSKTARERFDFIRRSRRYINCFRLGHSSGHCPSPYKCKRCNKSYHTLLHFPNNNASLDITVASVFFNNPPVDEVVKVNSAVNTLNTNVDIPVYQPGVALNTLLAIAVVRVEDK